MSWILLTRGTGNPQWHWRRNRSLSETACLPGQLGNAGCGYGGGVPSPAAGNSKKSSECQLTPPGSFSGRVLPHSSGAHVRRC